MAKNDTINLDSTIETIDKTNKNIIHFLGNPFVKYGFLIFVVLRIIFIDSMDIMYLELLDYTWVKVGYALLVAYSACFDPVYAIALATFIIIAIQELHRRRATKSINNQLQISTSPDIRVHPSPSVPINTQSPLVLNNSEQLQVKWLGSKPDDTYIQTDKTVFETINKQVLQKPPTSGDSLIAEYDYYEDPAFKTLTTNLNDKNYLGNNKFYVAPDNLGMIQTNQNPGVNQNTSVQPFNASMMNVQGMPMGFDKGLGGSNPELSSIH